MLILSNFSDIVEQINAAEVDDKYLKITMNDRSFVADFAEDLTILIDDEIHEIIPVPYENSATKLMLVEIIDDEDEGKEVEVFTVSIEDTIFEIVEKPEEVE